MIELNKLIAAGVSPTQARVFLPLLQTHAPKYEVDRRTRIAAFLAQAMHESAKFTRLEENLYYSSAQRIYDVFSRRFRSPADAAEYTRNPQKLANRVYSSRLGNGNEGSGDGWLYRGRGIFQLTGRDNYREAEQEIGRPYVAQPELVAQAEDAVITALHFWAKTGCNTPADSGDIDGVTRRINGAAMEGRVVREQLYRHVLDVL